MTKRLKPTEIDLGWHYEVEQRPRGVVVIIDANAATTNIPLILSKKPRRLIVVNEKKLAQAKLVYPGALLVGESDILDLAHFVASNNPPVIDKTDLANRDVLWMSVNGSRLIEAYAQPGAEVVTCAFNNMAAVKKWFFRNRHGQALSIIVAGNRGMPMLEDYKCGEVLRNILLGESYDWEEVKKEVKDFLATVPEYAPNYRANLPYILDRDRFKIVPRIERNEEGFLEIKDAL